MKDKHIVCDTAQRKMQDTDINYWKNWMKAWVDRTSDIRTLRKVLTVMRTLDTMEEELNKNR